MRAMGIVGSPRKNGNKGEVKSDEEGLATAWELGKNIAFLVKKLKA